MLTILIVDDEKLERNGIKFLLKREQEEFNILEAGNGKDALGVLATHHVDILFSDVKMPYMNGLQLARPVNEMSPDMELVIYSGYNDSSYATEALRLGAVDYLLKPVEQEDLMRALEKAARNIPDFKGNTETLNAEKIVEKAKIYIKENSNREISRAEVAEQFFIHPDYLSHIFKEWAGITFQDFVIKTRMDKAKKMLIYTDTSISNIAASTGYSNTAYFAKHFKRETGMTPKEYRQNARTAE